jgi:hypothetical protein
VNQENACRKSRPQLFMDNGVFVTVNTAHKCRDAEVVSCRQKTHHSGDGSLVHWPGRTPWDRKVVSGYDGGAVFDEVKQCTSAMAKPRRRSLQ